MLELKDIKKNFFYHFKKIKVLEKINFKVEAGDFIALMGKSGSGKTTLLNIIAGLIKPSGGELFFNQKHIPAYDFFLSRYRRKNIGFVFQNFNLIDYLSVLDNVVLPLKFSVHSLLNQRKAGMEILEKVGLADRAKYYPGMLSGGQLQRCAIARALINKPSLIIADEPTGNLDNKTATEILEIFHGLNKNENITFIVVTHEKGVIDMSNRTLYLRNGELSDHPDDLTAKVK